MKTDKFLASSIQSLLNQAIEKHQVAEFEQAESLYKKVLQIKPEDKREQDLFAKKYHLTAVNNLGVLFEQQEKLEQALAAYQTALEIEPDYAQTYYNLGNILQKQGQLDAAIAAYQQAISLNPDIPQIHNNLGNALQLQGQLEAAIESYQQALEIKPDYPQAHHNLGNVQQKQGKLKAAIESYQQALEIKPDYPQAHHNLGNTLKQQGKLKAAIESYQQALDLQPNDAETYNNLGHTFYEQGKLEAAIESYQQALNLNPDLTSAKFGIVIAQLPVIYSSFAEINIKRDNYRQHLQNLAKSYTRANSEDLKKAVDAVGSVQPFLLAYQDLNDRDLQQTYGEMLVQIMSNSYPQWSQPLPIPSLETNEKIRIGFVSGYFYNHSNWKIPLKGWVENLDRNNFELYGFHTGLKQDQVTAQAVKEFSKFVKGPLSLEEWCAVIRQNQLHILIFPEFGMDPMTVKLGCLRLAPIQIGSSLGNAETSGLPTIDYYLSSELMEPENAQEHYTEKLVKLPNLAFHYTPFAIKPKAISKKDLGIEEHEIMFWCCQSLFKYLPQHDDIFPRIAQELVAAKFVFLGNVNENIDDRVSKIFRQRLSRAFEELGLNYQNHCVFLPQNWDSRSFAGTTAIADVYLDSIGWTGGNSSIEAIGYNLPIVTLPGKLMRGRMTMAFLKMIGIEEAIASSKEEYVQLAIRLGKDAKYRQNISQLIAQNKHKLYGDLEPIRALEEFLLNTVGKERRSTNTTVIETLRLAIQEHRANHLEQAERAYHQVLSIQSNQPEALYGLGVLAQQQGEFSKAEQFLSAAIQVQPDAAKIWFTLGNLHQLQGQLSSAETAYQRALTLRPDAASIHNNLGYTLQQQGKWSEAIICYQKALKLQHKCVEAEVNLGNALHVQGKLSPEKRAYYAELNHKLGLEHQNAGDGETAEIYFQKALELNSNYREVSQSLSKNHESQQKSKKAETTYFPGAKKDLKIEAGR